MRVLVVDDSEQFRMLARLVAGLVGGLDVVGEADTGEAAVIAARRLDAEVVLMDVRLPGIDGIDATRRILDEQPHRVVILVSAQPPEDHERDRLSGCGAAGYLLKEDFGPAQLRAALAG
jgi:two-component system, NarL family, invasion response regulator UvrY